MGKSERKFLVKVGGSLLFNEKGVRINQVQKFADLLKKSDNIVGIVVGGGLMARTYIQAARNLGANESMGDTFGIEVSRLNARLLITALGESAYPEPIISLEQARIARLFNKIIVAGGFVPGQSTTSVTFEIAESLNATDILVLTNVDGVFDKDPHKHPDAKKFDQLDVDTLEDVILGKGGETQSAAGEYRIFDAVSIQIFKRSTIKVRLMNGEDLSQLDSYLLKKQYDAHIGTEILREK
jgi:uridylate kinase